MKLGLIVIAVAVLAACHTTPPPSPPAPDASDAAVAADVPPGPPDACQLGCAALVSVGCMLGDGGADCAGFLRTMQDDGKEPNKATGKPLRCDDVAAVHSKADAVRLGFVCPP